MIIKDLKEIIKNLPDEMPVGLFDITTDDVDDCNYPIERENFEVMDCVNQYEEETGVKGLFIVFENKLNENPI